MVYISEEERDIIIHAKTSCLYNSGEHWGKRSSSNLFDVTMGSYDGAESCELVGSFLLHLITAKHGKKFGLYRDDGLGIVKESAREIERIKKDLCSIFNTYGLKITIEANEKIVNFLDVTLNLSTGKYQPYSKPNNIPLYVHSKSNHPPGILRNIPLSINKRLTEISSDEASFQHASQQYQEALQNSGYKHQLKYQHPLNQKPPRSQNHRRNIIWYNPPFSKNVSTNIGQTFLRIIDDEFPANHCLRKIFNRNTVKSVRLLFIFESTRFDRNGSFVISSIVLIAFFKASIKLRVCSATRQISIAFCKSNSVSRSNRLCTASSLIPTTILSLIS